ncbi:MAG: hypothetical protein ABJA66_13470 [Actinomycetota bacterium]
MNHTKPSCCVNSPRSDATRKHADVDLGFGVGSTVYAIAKGTIIKVMNRTFLVKAEKKVGIISIK